MLLFLAIQKLFRSKCKVIHLDQFYLLLCAISCLLFVGKQHSEISSTYMLIISCYLEAIQKQVQGDTPRSFLSFIVENSTAKFVRYFVLAICWKIAQRNQQHLHAKFSCYLEAIQKQVQGAIPRSVLLLCAISCPLFVGKQHSKISSTYLLLFIAIQNQFEGEIPGSDNFFIVCYFLPASLLENSPERNQQHLHANFSSYLECYFEASAR